MEVFDPPALEARLLSIDTKLDKLLLCHANVSQGLAFHVNHDTAVNGGLAGNAPAQAWPTTKGELDDSGSQKGQLKSTLEGPWWQNGQTSRPTTELADDEDEETNEPRATQVPDSDDTEIPQTSLLSNEPEENAMKMKLMRDRAKTSFLSDDAADDTNKRKSAFARSSKTQEGASLAVDKIKELEEERKAVRKTLKPVEHMDHRMALAPAVAEFVGRREFEWFIATLIALNALVLGLQIDWQVKSPAEADTPIPFRVWEVFCTSVFTIELALRLFAHGLALFRSENPNRFWYMFDAFLVSFTLIDEFMLLIKAATLNASLVRLFRMFRLVRILRLIRMVRMLHDLRIMVAGIMSSLRPLFWATVLVCLFMYIYAIVLLQLLAEDLTSTSNVELSTSLKVYFESLSGTIYTLSQSISGGLDWGEPAEPLGDISAFIQCTYGMFIGFSILCMFNVVTGCLVDKAVKTTALDEERMMMEDIEDRKKWLVGIKKIFEEADTDGSHFLDKEEFMAITAEPKMRYYFRKIGLDMDIDNVGGIFEFLDIDNDGEVDVDEFTIALQYLHKPPRAIDLARIQHSLRKNFAFLEDMAAKMDEIKVAPVIRAPKQAKGGQVVPRESPALLPGSVPSLA